MLGGGGEAALLSTMAPMGLTTAEEMVLAALGMEPMGLTTAGAGALGALGAEGMAPMGLTTADAAKLWELGPGRGAPPASRSPFLPQNFRDLASGVQAGTGLMQALRTPPMLPSPPRAIAPGQPLRAVTNPEQYRVSAPGRGGGGLNPQLLQLLMQLMGRR